MKSIIASLALLLACATAQAETLTPESCGTGQTAYCQAPAADVSYLTYNYVYGTVTLLSGGELYSAVVGHPVPPYSTVSFSQLVYATDGTSKLVTATLTVKAVHASPRTAVLQWTLTSGSVE